MKRTLAGLLLLGACTRTTKEVPVSAAPSPITAISTPGAAPANGPRPALDAFMSAIQSQDIQALGLAWGDKTGPVRDMHKLTREDLEQRELILLKCLKFDKYRILTESPAADGERVMTVEITTGTRTRAADFFSARGPDRWYVRTIEPPCSTK